jgi:hypothetical protein
MALTAQEVWDLSLDTPDERVEELKLGALERMGDGAYEEVLAAIGEKREASIEAVVELPPDMRRAKAKTVWDCLGYAVDTNTGLSKYWGRVLVYCAMIPLDSFESESDKRKTRINRAIIEALGLVEVATAVFTYVYLVDDGPRTLIGRRNALAANGAAAS